MKKVKHLSLIVGLALIFCSSSADGQTSTAPAPKTVKPESPVLGYALLIENEDGKQTTLLRSADLDKLKRRTVKVNDHGKEATFEGYALFEVLKLADIEFGDALRGKRLATFLLVEAADKYQAIFALPELDPAFTDKLVLLADKRDGSPLSKTEGELRLVVPDEKKAARWVRQVTSMKILRASGAGK